MAATAARPVGAHIAERPAGPALGLGRADLAAEPGAGDRARRVASPRLDLGEGIVAHAYLLSRRFHPGRDDQGGGEHRWGQGPHAGQEAAEELPESTSP